MKLNKKLWALVDSEEKYVVWDHEAPIVATTKKEIEEELELKRKIEKQHTPSIHWYWNKNSYKIRKIRVELI